MKLFKRPQVLIAGPWLDELGWELAIWQAAVRYQRISKCYEKVYVITFKNREYLYEDCEIYPHNEELINAGFGINKVPQEKINQLLDSCIDYYAIKEKFDLFTPNKFLSKFFRLKRKIKNDILHRKFYSDPIDDKYFDIAFHFRSFERDGDDFSPKSFSPEKADQIAELCKLHGFSVCCIGAPGYSYVAKGTENRQSHDLLTSISYICVSRLVVGVSSAPMHLASLCGIPIVVWIGSPPGANRYFTTTWNPFNSKVFLVTEKTFNPSVEEIFCTINNAISQIST